jgi:hypothetical protein
MGFREAQQCESLRLLNDVYNVLRCFVRQNMWCMFEKHL